jgi:phenylpropionate dioxygenase-like ring-hydroxylating dioxygenase large terminal subunit
MMSSEDNEILTRVGPGTAMGEFMRRFWMPVMLSNEIGGPDEAPVRIRILGENLVAFRDSDGRAGLLDEHCPHRRASMFFGRNEECGLRCLYHGWKFDVNGACVDMPSEPADSNFADKVQIKAYPTQEKGGVLWAYMGPKEKMGEVPNFEWMSLGDDYHYVSRWHQNCNYAQSVEGEIDSAHVSFLHSRVDELDEQSTALSGSFFACDTAPKWKVNETEYGLVLGARRTDAEGYYWRMNQWLYPFHSMIAPVPGVHTTNRMWVPIDDTHTSVICVSYDTGRPYTDAELQSWQKGERSHHLTQPGSLEPVANYGNDYLIDREVQRTQTYSGMPAIRAEDAAMVETARAIADRSLERLGSSDTTIIQMRKLMVEGAKALMQGIEPAAARGGSLYAVRSYSTVIQEDADFDELPVIIEAMAVAEAAE